MTTTATPAALKAALSTCLLRDRQPLKRKLQDVEQRLRKNQPA